MKKFVSRPSCAPLFFVAACTLGAVAACNSQGTDGAGGQEANAGASQGGGKSNAGAPGAGASSTAGSAAEGGRMDGIPGSASPGDGGTSGAGGASTTEGGEGGTGGEAPCVPEPASLPTGVPAALAAPEGVNLLRHFHAVGTQNYRCTVTAGVGGAEPTYAWVFIAPAANLLNSCGKIVGTHFAALNSNPPAPEWQYDVDGSSVIGAKLAGSPLDGAIPELLLQATEHGGNGVFSQVSYVQRLRTAGGAAPDAASCDSEHVNDEQDVAYTAEYYFYAGGN